MTRIDFYILPESAGPADSPVITACRLCEKAVGAGLRIYAHVDDRTTAEGFDGALWSFRQGGFIAHERYDGQAIEAPLPPVLIGSAEPPDTHHDVLVNLGTEVPDFFSRFERVLEIVAGDAAQRAASRTHYKFYRDRGYELNTFEQSADGGWTRRSTQ
ncbi:DNA polymerase III subunit chi [Sinimarinibacterium flocculans]|uniref:DNA polymerase III chi subunit n=1 Tax=Sinimarinibacterium flocculans TaxID=985250 RepID=A0A318E4H9_9GAMM|nr:DNA polymerase III subunit chi [Sinimarinibacterium flocculans]PXV66111.1 DNA polymerase III chi subunit [Sinimarinibacterium flocculans]